MTQAPTKKPCFWRILDEHGEIWSDLVAGLVEGEDRKKRPRGKREVKFVDLCSEDENFEFQL